MNHLATWILSVTAIIIAFGTCHANDETPLVLYGKVKESIWKTDLPSAKVVMYDNDGNPSDTIDTSFRIRNKYGDYETKSNFSLKVNRNDSICIFDVICPGYQTQTISYPIGDIGKREGYRQLPIIYLDRESHKLGEVTVTASKIKFYNKGDTIVYNADAFQLAEGSMLDALIAQLPGVELNSEGQISINGEFVESLLLNGKQFLGGNNQLMLENIGAYTVKNVEVYKGQTAEEKWVDDPSKPKHLTMDVKLKKEYSIGWIINAQGGLGTKDRYSGRLFASWFNPTTNLTFLANFNNLNDNRKPGKNDTWTPEQMPSGTKQYKMASLNYNYGSADEMTSADGYVTFEETRANNMRSVSRTNFLSGGDTYENSFSTDRNSNLKLETRNNFRRMTPKFLFGAIAVGRYIKRTNSSSDLSASFDSEQTDITRQAIEALYSDGSPEMLDAVINRSISRSDGSSHEREIQFYPGINYKFPNSNDRLYVEFGVKYQDKKEHRWDDYLINYGSNPTPAETKRQYFDNTPNRTLTLTGNLEYTARIMGWVLGADYEYRFVNRDRDSYMYALDALADMGIYGTLPSNYLDAFDPSNSYTSRLIENKHSINPIIFRNYVFGNGSELIIRCRPELSIHHRHLDYWRDNRSYLVKSTSFMAVSKKYSSEIFYHFGVHQKRNRKTYTYQTGYNYTIDTELPNALHMIDIENTSNPLNISLGNPDLKNAYKQNHEVYFYYNPANKTLSNQTKLNYGYTTNALVRGYTYETSTGIRRSKTYNVSGNTEVGLNNHFSLQFGNRDQFTLTSTSSERLYSYADMIGVNLAEPTKSTVKSNMLSEKVTFAWQIGKQNLQLIGSVTNRHTTSSREDFNNITANHFNYGVLGQFTLPYGFGISSDFMLYSRRGYGVKELDTTDAVWNMRVTYTPKGGHWVVMLDGFDMLHQLSNVNYAVNASGRTVTYTNSLPRYIMLSVQYRLNIQPKNGGKAR